MKSEFKSFNTDNQYPKLLQSERVIILATKYNKLTKLYHGTVVSVIDDKSTYKVGEYREDWCNEPFVDCLGTVTLSNN